MTHHWDEDVNSLPGGAPGDQPIPRPPTADGHADFQGKRDHVGSDETTLYTSLFQTNAATWKTWVQKLIKNPRG